MGALMPKEKPVIIVAEGNFGVVGDMLNASLKFSDIINIFKIR